MLFFGCIGFSFLVDVLEGLSSLFFLCEEITQGAIVEEDALIVFYYNQLFEFLVCLDGQLTAH